jgi:hypothetical protein
MSNPDSIETPAERPAPDPEPRLPGTETALTLPVEIGGRGGLEPTRYGDWEKDGRCIDF